MFGTLKKTSSDFNSRIQEIDNKIKELQRRRERNNATSDKRMESLKPKPGVAEKGAAKRMRLATKELHSENNSIIKEIASLKKEKEKLLNKKKLQDAKSIYAKEYGGIEMNNIYTNEDVEERRLKLYDALREGVITESQFDELNDELDAAIDMYNESLEYDEDDDLDDDMMEESVDGEDETASMRLFIYESVREGTLTAEEGADMLDRL